MKNINNSKQNIFQSTAVRTLIQLSLSEDNAWSDCTSSLTISNSQRAKAELFAKENLVVCGLSIIPQIIAEYGGQLENLEFIADGVEVTKGKSLGSFTCSSQTLLACERTILNFIQRLSGYATKARALTKLAAPLKLLDTRKTTPGFRQLEKYAVRVGGALNHRASLSDLILIKNNHLDLIAAEVGSKRLWKTLQERLSQKSPYLGVEIEVRNLEELSNALNLNSEVIMLDNFEDSEIEAALKIVAKAKTLSLIEVSGGINEKRFSKLKALGVSFVSMGALTTKNSAVDISMKISAIASKIKPLKSKK